MARAKTMVNTLKAEIEDIEQLAYNEAREDWKNGEMACITTKIFGGDFWDYFRSCNKDIASKVNNCIYSFQGKIYSMMQNGKLSHKEYKYSYVKSKELLYRR